MYTCNRPIQYILIKLTALHTIILAAIYFERTVN